MTCERAQRVHVIAKAGKTITVQKVRQGHPTDDMSAVVVTDRAILISSSATTPSEPFPTTVKFPLDPEDARDLGLAITQAANELLAEQAKADES